VVTKSITGHVTEQMREHYSSVDLSEKREAIANVVRLVPRSSKGVVGEVVGESTKRKRPARDASSNITASRDRAV